MTGLLFNGAEWDFATLDRTYKAIEEIAVKDLGLDVYPNQIEIISSEQMLDAYSSMAMPLMYSHWSFGKLFAREETLCHLLPRALALKLINRNPRFAAFFYLDISRKLDAATREEEDARMSPMMRTRVAELPFQVRKRLTDYGLRSSELSPGSGEAALLGGRDEGAKLIQGDCVEHGSIYFDDGIHRII